MNAKMKNQIQKPYVRGETILRPIDKLNLALLTEPMMSKRLERRLDLVQFPKTQRTYLKPQLKPKVPKQIRTTTMFVDFQVFQTRLF